MRGCSFVAAMVIGVGSGAIARADAPPDRCIAFITTNLAKGNGAWYTYERFAESKLTVREGDTLSYRIYLDPRNPEAKGGVDADFADGGKSLRDLKLKDDHGVDVHGDGDLAAAMGKWYKRKIDISAAKGRTITAWTISEEGDKDGKYAQFVDDVVVNRANGERVVIYEDGVPLSRAQTINNGYTTRPLCIAIESSRLRDGGGGAEEAVKAAESLGERLKAIDEMRHELETVRKFAERDSDPHMKQHVEEAATALTAAEKEGATAEAIEAAIHTAKNALTHTHPMMEKYTGHLVGHAHIDLQWLWEWQEGIVFSHDTFAQVVKFMNEFKGFTFSQSSSCLYQAMEQHYPKLFADIQEKVKAGQWELVGGRVCEGDTNMISEESSARQFLYGQRYFREKFGKTAVVGWEPDTFGHTAQMPQMLRLAGCEYYYFCRAGKNKPLFWWEGLDGSRVLAFDEPASGSWYNADLSYKQFEEMAEFEKNTGSKDMLWVYGVGNHGGGPTREHIEWALEQMKKGDAGDGPKVRFSTATEFFKKLSGYDLTKIPVVKEELNTVFEGCYTTHSEVKQLNRQAEAMTTSAEAVAAAASLGGFAYPRAQFRRNWEDICFNHHHDTLPGSGIHAPYERTKTTLGRVIADDKDIITRAMESLVVRVKPVSGGVNVLVFNPTGEARSEWVETYLVRSGWDHSEIPDPDHCVAVAPDGSESPVTLVDSNSRLVRFLAGGVPPFGYRVFHLAKGEPKREKIEVRDDGATVETRALRVEFDRERGCIKRLMRKTANREACAENGGLGRLEAAWEGNQHMDAWSLGPIEKVDAIKAVSATFTRTIDSAEATFTYTIAPWNAQSRETRITQRFTIFADRDEVICDVDCEWNAVGTGASRNAMLRAAFDVRAEKAIAMHHVPFGAVSRPTDGHEFPALQWVDVSSGTPEGGGLVLINDSKHGFACKGSTLTMSLIRAPFHPDPVPNPGKHHWRYAIVAHTLDWTGGNPSERAAAFNQPLLAATVPYDASGSAPLEWRLLEAGFGNIRASAIKLAEEENDLVVRMYEPRGRAGQAVLASVAAGSVVNFVEDALSTLKPDGRGRVMLDFKPFEIKTVKVKVKGEEGK